MTEERWELSVAVTAEEHLEAMFTAGQYILKGRRRVVMWVYSLFVMFFAPIGAAMVFWVIVQIAGGPKFSELPAAAIPMAVVTFGILAIWLMRQGYVITARASAASQFGRAYDLVLAQDGVTLTTGYSRWHTGWHDVELVGGGKKTITIGISGIAFPLPRRAFLGPKDADEALAVMQRWQEASR